MITVNKLKSVEVMESTNDIYPDNQKGRTLLGDRIDFLKKRGTLDLIEHDYLVKLQDTYKNTFDNSYDNLPF